MQKSLSMQINSLINNDHKCAIISHNTLLKIVTPIMVGDLIKFSYTLKGKSEEPQRISYSKVTQIIPKIISSDEGHSIDLHYLTENAKYISIYDVINIEMRGQQ